MSYAYNILIYRGVGLPGNGKYFVDGLNATRKMFLSMLMTNMKLPGASSNDSQMVICTSVSNEDTSLARELNFPPYLTRAHGLIDHGKYRK